VGGTHDHTIGAGIEKRPHDVFLGLLPVNRIISEVSPTALAPSRTTLATALDKIDALKPSAVVAGHKIPNNDDSPRNVEETRRYIRDFIRLNDATKTAPELYDKMLELYPDRANPGSLWSAAATAKTQS
jgi:hypothetical protein